MTGDNERGQILALVAVRVDIDRRRATLRYAATEPALADLALDAAADLRLLEHAYYRLGGAQQDYWPAVYRQDRQDRLPAPPAGDSEGGEAGPPRDPARLTSHESLSGRSTTEREVTDPQPSPAERERTVAAVTVDAAAARPDNNRLTSCCSAVPPEHHPGCPLEQKIRDRKGDRYVSPLGDTREHPVACLRCRERTSALTAICDRCALDDAERALRHLDPDARAALWT